MSGDPKPEKPVVQDDIEELLKVNREIFEGVSDGLRQDLLSAARERVGPVREGRTRGERRPPERRGNERGPRREKDVARIRFIARQVSGVVSLSFLEAQGI